MVGTRSAVAVDRMAAWRIDGYVLQVPYRSGIPAVSYSS